MLLMESVKGYISLLAMYFNMTLPRNNEYYMIKKTPILKLLMDSFLPSYWSLFIPSTLPLPSKYPSSTPMSTYRRGNCGWRTCSWVTLATTNVNSQLTHLLPSSSPSKSLVSTSVQHCVTCLGVHVYMFCFFPLMFRPRTSSQNVFDTLTARHIRTHSEKLLIHVVWNSDRCRLTPHLLKYT